MELSIEQIRSIAHGVSRVEKIGESIGLFRFTKEQEILYKNRTSRSGLYARTFATAGVFLEFDTDSEDIFFAAEVSEGCGFRWFTHSIYVDDMRIGEVAGFIPENEKVVRVEGRFCMRAGRKRVRIQFPWNEASRILRLELDDGASLIPVKKQSRLLIFGDSITQGYITWLPENSYTARIARMLDATVVNKGIGGESYWPELACVREAEEPDAILVAYGANDWNEKTEDEFIADSILFCQNLRRSHWNARIVVVTPIWNKSREERQKTRWPFEKLVSHLKSLENVVSNLVVIEGTEFVPTDDACFAEDQVHPNDLGFAHYAENLRERLLLMN